MMAAEEETTRSHHHQQQHQQQQQQQQELLDVESQEEKFSIASTTEENIGNDDKTGTECDDDLGDDDDDEIVLVVSKSRRKNMSKISHYAPEPQHFLNEKFFMVDEVIDEDGNAEGKSEGESKKYLTDVDDDDDGILLVTIKPISSSSSLHHPTNVADRNEKFILSILFLTMVCVLLGMSRVFRRTRRKQQERLQTQNNKMNSERKSASTTSAGDSEQTSQIFLSSLTNILACSNCDSDGGDTNTTNKIQMRKTTHSPSGNADAKTNHHKSLSVAVSMQKRDSNDLSLSSFMPPPLLDEREIELAPVLTSSSSNFDGETNELLLLSRQNSTMQQREIESKQQMARQLVKDIQMVREVLVEHQLDPALAPNIAVSIQTSHELIAAQHKLEYNRTIVHLHQRQVDRQLSEKQHTETLRAAKYDPEWRTKLYRIIQPDVAVIQNRGEFAPAAAAPVNGLLFVHFDYLIRRLSSIWWNVFWVQLACRGLVPYVVQLYKYERHQEVLGTLTFTKNTAWGNTALAGMVQNLLWGVLSQVCSCRNGGLQFRHSGVSLVGNNSDGYTSITTFMLEWAKSAFSSSVLDQGSYTTSLLNVAKRIFLSSIVPVLERSTCYGSCLVSISTMILVSVVAHQGLRILSAPNTCHHVVNLVTLVTIWGPEQILAFLVSSIVFLSKRNTDEETILDEAKVAFWGKIADFFTLSILLLFPFWEWQTTIKVYRQAESRIDQALTADFDTVFKWGKNKLEQWISHLLLVRFAVFSLYSAVILWGVFQ